MLRMLSLASLRRLASVNQTRAEAAEQATADLQQCFDAQARELAEARARIAELERLLGGIPKLLPGFAGHDRIVPQRADRVPLNQQ